MKSKSKSTFDIDNNKFYIAAGIFFAGALVAGVLAIRKQRMKKKFGSFGFASSSSSGFCKHGDSYPLKRGSCGNNVKKLQQKLKSIGMDIGDFGPNKDGIDGKYGEFVERAVKKVLGRSTFELTDMQKLNTINVKT